MSDPTDVPYWEREVQLEIAHLELRLEMARGRLAHMQAVRKDAEDYDRRGEIVKALENNGGGRA